MATLPNAEASQQHREVIERGDYLFQQLLTRDLPSPDDHHLLIEMDIRPEFSNVRGALQGGLIAVLTDMCGGDSRIRPVITRMAVAQRPQTSMCISCLQ